jgi:mRNA-degrading endonuclease toxin of MazEF toxin-antitoxin module
MRPALVIQNDTGNLHAPTRIVAVTTTTRKEFPVTVVAPSGEGGLNQRSMINLVQLLSIDKGRLQKRLGRISDFAMLRVDPAIRVSLDV